MITEGALLPRELAFVHVERVSETAIQFAITHGAARACLEVHDSKVFIEVV